MLMRRATVLGAIVAVLVLASGALADTAPIPANTGLPWTDPTHHSPLELLASQIATQIAGRSVSARCEGDFDWNTLTQQRGFPPAELGYVDGQPYDTRTRLFVSSATSTELSPMACLALQDFATAPVKPTKCQPLVWEKTTVYVTERYKKKIRVRTNGKWVTRTVWRTRQVPQTVEKQVPGPFVPCYLGNQHAAWAEPESYWKEYGRYALGILVLTHESIHLAEVRAGVSVDAYEPASETHANCYGLQWVAYAATALGAAPEDARAISRYAFDYVYPGYQGVTWNGSPYWSADCRENGPLDLTPNDSVWP